MKQVIKTFIFMFIASMAFASCGGDGNSSNNDGSSESSESSLSSFAGTWECDFYDMGSLNIMYLTIKSDGSGHLEWTYQQGFQTVTIMNERVNIRRYGNELEVSTLHPSEDEGPAVFFIKGDKIYMPNGEEMKRNYNH